ncbi:MAG: peptide chain release factor N(5)-glutamine methyltransferase [Clostridiales bacterium]|nr:peptide chain release factor N(5)-glutamine methyltransferase [Clostridiales bacterium]
MKLIKIRKAIFSGKKFLDKNNIKSSFLDSILIFEKVTGLKKEELLISDDNLNSKNLKKIIVLLFFRSRNVPIQYLISRQEFMKLNFFVNTKVLVPRRDTEILCEEILSFSKNKNFNVIDLCSGSGCIAIALKKYNKKLNITALEISKIACEIIKKNSKINKTNIKIINKDLFRVFNESYSRNFDLIVSNPPYIKKNEIKKLEKNIKKFEPLIALDGGHDGLKFYDYIIKNIKHSCVIFFEIGFDQADKVKKILLKNNFFDIIIKKDLAGLDRIISAKK